MSLPTMTRTASAPALVLVIAALLATASVLPATAAPWAAGVAADRARVEAAVDDLVAARQKTARIEAQVASASAELDRILADERAAQERLDTRARVMYRSGAASFVEVLLGAASFPDFAARWDLLMRMSRQDAEDLVTLRTAQAEAAATADALMALQAEQAEAVDAADAEVARARKRLAASEAALKTYEAQVAASAKKAATPKPSGPSQSLKGKGEWKTAVASHYGRSFTGRGASGKAIGPYSMMCAHKTLPFGTLVEFEYNGRRAVASVEDRGPFTPGRDFDLGPGVVRALDFGGVKEVRYRIISR